MVKSSNDQKEWKQDSVYLLCPNIIKTCTYTYKCVQIQKTQPVVGQIITYEASFIRKDLIRWDWPDCSLDASVTAATAAVIRSRCCQLTATAAVIRSRCGQLTATAAVIRSLWGFIEVYIAFNLHLFYHFFTIILILFYL